MKGSHVVSIAAIKLGSCNQEVIVGPPQRRPGHPRGRPIRLLKNAYLLRSPHPSSLRRTSEYASLLGISGALHLGIFDQPAKSDFSASCWDYHFKML
jgi:hypothetical protein